MALEKIGLILISNKDASDMKKGIQMNITVLEREIRRGKREDSRLDIFKAARKLFEI